MTKLLSIVTAGDEQTLKGRGRMDRLGSWQV